MNNHLVIMIISPSLLLPSELYEICTSKDKPALTAKYGNLTVTVVQGKVGGIFEDINDYLDNVVELEAKFQARIMKPFRLPAKEVVRYAEELTKQHQCWRN